MPEYDKLASVYNYLMRKVRYDIWADYIYSVSEVYIIDRRECKTLELAGGNCNLAAYFTNYFPFLIVTDLSLQMLLSTKKKKIKRVCCNMVSLPFKGKFDLIYSTFDSINYLLSKKSLLNLFIEVRNILSENGIFTFDVSLEENSIKHVKMPLRKGVYKGISFIHESIYDKKSRIHKNIFELNFKNGEKFKEIHKQKIYPFEIYFELLDNAELYAVECFDGFSFSKGSAASKRVQFVVKRK